MKKCIYLFMLFTILFISGCPLLPEVITLNWTGAWENGVDGGTYKLDMVMEGENMAYDGGYGTLTGSIVCQKYDGTVLVDSAISGTWDNDREDMEIDISSDDGLLTMWFLTRCMADDLGNDDSMIGNFELNAVPGNCYVNGSRYQSPDVQSVRSLVSTYSFGDITYVQDGADQYLYAVTSDSVFRVNIQDGTVSDLVIVSGMDQGSLAFDGSYLWITGKAAPGDTFFSLYKFLLSDLTAPEAGYPLALNGYGGINLTSFSISHNGTNLYYHNNDFFYPEMGMINTADGSCSYIIPGSMGSALSRTNSIAAYSNGFHTSFFASGGDWCRIKEFDLSGTHQDSFCPPVNGGASMALNGSIMYLIQERRLYTVQL